MPPSTRVGDPRRNMGQNSGGSPGQNRVRLAGSQGGPSMTGQGIAGAAPLEAGTYTANGVGGGGRTWNLTPQQTIDFSNNRQDINRNARFTNQNLTHNRGLAALNHQQTQANVLRSLTQGQEDLRRNVSQSLEDLQRSIGFSREDLERNIRFNREDLERNSGFQMEDLQRSFDRNSEDLTRNFGRAEQDLGIQRRQDMTALIDSLGARGIRGSGVGNRFQGQAADAFDLQGQRLGEDRNLGMNRLADDLAFGQGRVQNNLDFGLNRLSDQLSFGNNRLSDQLSFGEGRLNSNLDFGLQRMQSDSDWNLAQATAQWEQADAGFALGLAQNEVFRGDMLDQNREQRQVWSGENDLAAIGTSGGRQPGRRPGQRPGQRPGRQRR